MEYHFLPRDMKKELDFEVEKVIKTVRLPVLTVDGKATSYSFYLDDDFTIR